jgi:hypothetical protein
MNEKGSGMKKAILACAVVALALLTAAYEAASTVPAAPERTENPSLVIGGQALDGPRTPTIQGASGSLEIRESHSDGGYWYWEERQPALAP